MTTDEFVLGLRNALMSEQCSFALCALMTAVEAHGPMPPTKTQICLRLGVTLNAIRVLIWKRQELFIVEESPTGRGTVRLSAEGQTTLSRIYSQAKLYGKESKHLAAGHS